MKKTVALILFLALVLSISLPTFAADYSDVDSAALDLNAKSVILMEAKTGTVLYENNADEPLPPASVTKIMTILLVMEAIADKKASLDDTVTASAYATSMGGSQIYLKEGEQMPLSDMLKSVIIASASDCAVALAEHIAGSEEVFVARMNERARELGMKNTNFENTNGLDDTAQNHVTSARDIAIMSREVIKYETVLEYSSRWQDTVRNGEFGLTNTNRLVRFYKGTTGLKTGSTAKAGFCVSATAERGGMSLIAVVMGSPSRDERNEAAKTLLDWGFANYALYSNTPSIDGKVRVLGGKTDSVEVETSSFAAVVPKGSETGIEVKTELAESVAAPIKAGDKLGTVKYIQNGKTVGETDICAKESVDKISFGDVLLRIFGILFMR
ncbi:MAG: D-alanyl-D-alanine carboxypeptidase [Ruminococcaceae bacterium]|nr:D-alanyl-D-alanine carboxypeptidase [Oscillospiraceae bacterium]